MASPLTHSGSSTVCTVPENKHLPNELKGLKAKICALNVHKEVALMGRIKTHKLMLLPN